MNSRLKPTMHDDFLIEDRVRFNLDGTNLNINENSVVTGTIVGVSTVNIISIYIILLDTPVDVPGYNKPWKAVSIPGVILNRI